MNVQDFNLTCSQCGKKVGVVTVIGGTMNIATVEVCCMECLPARLERLDQEGYDPEELRSVKEWMEK